MSPMRLVMVATVAAAGSAPVAASDPDLEKLRARCIDVTALVYGPADTKEPKALAGALIMDTDKRLLLAPDTDVPDAPTVVFPAYTAKGELRNKSADYTEMWKKGERWAGKTLHRDKERDLAVIELARALPDRARSAKFRAKSALIASTIYALNKKADDKMWELQKGEVSAIGMETFLISPRSYPPKGPRRITVTAPRGTGPDCGLFDKEGRVAGFASPPEPRDILAHSWLDVTEVRAFLEAKKVPFLTAPGDKEAPAAAPPPAPKTPAEDEKAADVLLKRAAVFSKDPDNRDYYADRLRELIKKYPKTAAAREAQKILDGMK